METDERAPGKRGTGTEQTEGVAEQNGRRPGKAETERELGERWEEAQGGAGEQAEGVGRVGSRGLRRQQAGWCCKICPCIHFHI